MPPLVAGALVFCTSAAVLVLEILAGRLLAPYVGDTLETYSGVIGTVLAGIAVGTWAGGRLADRHDPRRLIGPLLVAGGVLAMVAIPIVRVVGPIEASELERVLLLAGLGFFPTAAVLSAVSPVVVKLQLDDLAVTGQVVGRLSALGTAGGILGTFLAGFVLIEAAPTTTTIVVVGSLLVAAGVVAWLALDRMRATSAVAIAALGLGGASLGYVVGNGCERETTYHCARVEEDPDRPSGRVLWLDTLRHSYVDLDDPGHLEFTYTKGFAAALDVLHPGTAPIDALHVGGGALTMARHIESTRPGSRATVLEIDGGLVELVREELGEPAGAGLDVRVGDARMLTRELPDDAFDVVLGDAFGGLAVPWHLTTEEFVAELDRVLAPDGSYVVNVIDRPPLRFARAEVATLATVFPHLAVVAPPGTVEGTQPANLVLVASHRPLSETALRRAVAERGLGHTVLVGADLAAWVGDSPTLTDDHAPVDQWLANAGQRRRTG